MAKFDFSAETGVIFDGAHDANCLPLSEKEFQRKGQVLKILQSPEKRIEFEDLAVTCLSEWGASSSTVARIIEKAVIKKSYLLIEKSNNPLP